MTQAEPQDIEADTEVNGQTVSVDVHGGLDPAHWRNFEFLCHAAKTGQLCLSHAFDRAEGRFRPVVCVVSEINGRPSLMPVAPMVEEEPYLRFLPVSSGTDCAH